MSSFNIQVVEVEISPHGNADKLELAKIGGFNSIVAKGSYQTGDKVVYIPEQSILPDDVIDTLGLTGKLSGKAKNRVKAIRLRGVLSQGLVHPLNQGRLQNGEYSIGDDLQDALGIVKYIPQVPEAMNGDVNGSATTTLKYDIENFKRQPDLIDTDTAMLATEKIHGTWCCFGVDIKNPQDTIVTSKGLSSKQLIFKIGDGDNTGNLYVRLWRELQDQILNVKQPDEVLRYFILGEIYGRGVQDMHYGLNEKSFKVFDVYVDNEFNGRYLTRKEIEEYCISAGLDIVPIIERFVMPESVDDRINLLSEISLRDSVVGGQLMEGVVIKPADVDVTSPQGDRWIQKFVSEKYLMRQGDVTEYE